MNTICIQTTAYMAGMMLAYLQEFTNKSTFFIAKKADKETTSIYIVSYYESSGMIKIISGANIVWVRVTKEVAEEGGLVVLKEGKLTSIVDTKRK